MRRLCLVLMLVVLGIATPSLAGPSGSVNIRDFGAVGDGVHDDQPNIQAAINAAGNGGTVVCPPGTYRVNTALAVNAPILFTGTTGFAVNVGATYNACNVVAGTAAQDVFFVHLPSTDPYPLQGGQAVFRDLLIGTLVAKTAGSGIVVDGTGGVGCATVSLERVWVYRQWYGVYLGNGCGSTIRGSRISHFLFRGLTLSTTNLPDGGMATVSDTYIVSVENTSAVAVDILSGGGIYFTGNTLQTIGPVVVSLQWYPVGSCTAVPLPCSSDLLLTGNIIEGAQVGIDLRVNGTASFARTHITGNEIAVRTTPIRMSTAYPNTLYAVTVTGNNLAGGDGTGSCLDINDVDLVSISNNICTGRWSSGILVREHATNVEIGANQITGATTMFSFLNSSTRVLGWYNVPAASLPAAQAGSHLWCSDCVLTGTISVCSGGGSGSTATRIAGAWRCQ